MRVSVLLAPAPPPPGTDCAIIVDVLRATTTLTVALTNGARGVVPAASPDQALALRARHPGSLACGEREGRIVDGFDLGNSPFEYSRERVSGRTLVFASTNGSQAMIAAGSVPRRLLAAFVNAGAAALAVPDRSRVAILCAGKLGGFSLEDTACAGLLAARLEARGATLEGAGARLARSLAPGDAAEVRALVEGAAHARYLASLGPEFARDVEFCCALDSIDAAFDVANDQR